MATRERLEQALRNAHAAGDTAAAQRFAAAIRNGEYDQESPEPTGADEASAHGAGGIDIASPALEFMAGVNRGAARLADFLTTDQINAISQIIGSDKRVPSIESWLAPGTAGGFMDEGVARDVVGTAGEVIPAAVATGQALRNAAAQLPRLAGGSESVTAGALRQAGGSTGTQDAFYGGVSGAGGAAGGAAGKELGGDVGEQIGTIAGSVAAPLTLLGAANSATRRGAKELEQAARIQAGSTDKDLARVQESRKQTPVYEKIAGLISSNPQDPLSRAIVKGSPRVEADKTASEAIKQGFDEGVIAAIKGASRADAERMLKMARISNLGSQDARFAAENRPLDVAGDSLAQRIRYIRSVNKEAGRKLDAEANKLRGQEANFEQPVNRFISALGDMGVEIGGDLKPVFRGSDIEGVAGAERAINQIVGRMRDTRAPDAYDMHRLKRYIDENVSYGKLTEGLSGRVERVVKQLRADIDGALDNQFPSYNKVNTQYSDTIRVLDDIQSAAGSSINLLGENADKALGSVTRRLLSNAQSRVNLLDSIRSADDVARKYGHQFDDDLLMQVMFADELDSVFGAAARTSLQGDIGKSVRRGMNLAQGKGITEMAVDATVAGADKVRGINKENAYHAILDLLRRESTK